MSAVENATGASSHKSAKKKKNKKKKSNGPLGDGAKTPEVNGSKDEPGHEDEDEGEDEDGAEDMANTEGIGNSEATTEELKTRTAELTLGNNVSPEDDLSNHVNSSADGEESSDTVARFEVMQNERDNLRAEVTQLRQQLESIQSGQSDGDETASLRQEVEKTREEKEQAEAQYRALLGRVNTLRTQLQERLKADTEKLEQAETQIEELNTQNAATKEENARLQKSVLGLNSELETQAAEVETLRSRSSLSTNNWARERDDLISREAYLLEEYNIAKQAMQDWEILATEERARREALEDKFHEVDDQLKGQKEAYDRVKNEAETQSSTVDGLQRALRDLQEERKRELRELVEQSQAQLDELRKQAKSADESATELKRQLEMTGKDLERALPYEKEVREKNLLIGKLRHEAVILNDHLTKALRFLKRGKPEDNVDRQLVTNHLLQFLALDRSDAKKFQVLQLIAALLGWTEEQREQAGLLRQGSISGAGSLKLPLSPYRRTPSTPSLSADFLPDSSSATNKESLAELWSDFLERESESGKTRSRKGSGATTVRSPSLTGMLSPLSGKFDVGAPASMPKLQREDSTGQRSDS